MATLFALVGVRQGADDQAVVGIGHQMIRKSQSSTRMPSGTPSSHKSRMKITPASYGCAAVWMQVIVRALA